MLNQSDFIAAFQTGNYMNGPYAVDLSTDPLAPESFATPPHEGLQAGDANLDFRFDEADIDHVLTGGKYMTGLSALWGEGDWNGAPGGSQGNPPAGDNRFNQLDIIAALNTGLYLTGPYGAVIRGGQGGDEQTSIIYDANTGEVGVDAPAAT